MTEKSLTPLEQKTVEFYGDDLTAVRASDGHIYVSIRHMTDALGLDRRGQVRRIQRQNILHEGYFMGDILSPKGRRKAGWLRVDLVPLFLTGVSTKSAKDEIRPKLERFQREAAKVLWEAFQEGRLTADPTFDELLRSDSPAVQAYRTALAVLQMARNQVLIEGRLQTAESQLVVITNRLEQVEETLGDSGRSVTPDQAAQISQGVKSIALVLSKRSGHNEYGAVYGQLYRDFGVTSYKLVPARRFDEVMKYLTEWHQSLVGDVPF